MKPGYLVDLSRVAMTPRAAAKHDPDAFLQFAADVEKIALKLRAERSQLEMDL